MANLNLFNIFIAVAKHGNITKASESLFISQPAITKSIKMLESELGGKLFIRKNKGVELTYEGKHIYQKVLPLISEMNDLYSYFHNIKKLKDGALRIGTTTSNITILLSNSLNEFTQAHPNVEIKVNRDNENNLITQLKNNELDLIILDSQTLPVDSTVVTSFEVNYSVVGNKKFYNKFIKNPLTKEGFARLPLALIGTDHTSRQNIDSYFNQFGIYLTPKYEMENYGLVIDLIKRGIAVGVVNADYFKKELSNEELFILNTDFIMEKRIISIVHDKNQTNPAKLKFINLIKKEIK